MIFYKTKANRSRLAASHSGYEAASKSVLLGHEAVGPVEQRKSVADARLNQL
jgi:hypothetical protein